MPGTTTKAWEMDHPPHPRRTSLRLSLRQTRHRGRCCINHKYTSTTGTQPPRNHFHYGDSGMPLIMMLLLHTTAIIVVLSPQSTTAWTNSLVVAPRNHHCRVVRGSYQKQQLQQLFASVSPSEATSNSKDIDTDNDGDTDNNNNTGDVEQWYQNMDVLPGGEDDADAWYGDDTLEDWIPDAQKAKQKPTHLTPAKEVIGNDASKENENANQQQQSNSRRPSPYTEEEEDLIAAMGGKAGEKKQRQTKRQDGFLGDSTLKEIATDYSIPICYLADVLCMWNVPPPISIQDRLGDMVTGEQAFALVEAVHSLDVGALHDRYSNQNLLQVCYEWNIDIKNAFEFAMKEGWSLPFGVRTNLRVEQEEELLRIFSPLFNEKEDDQDSEGYDEGY